jgi:hypothetical protein
MFRDCMGVSLLASFAEFYTCGIAGAACNLDERDESQLKLIQKWFVWRLCRCLLDWSVSIAGLFRRGGNEALQSLSCRSLSIIITIVALSSESLHWRRCHMAFANQPMVGSTHGW